MADISCLQLFQRSVFTYWPLWYCIVLQQSFSLMTFLESVEGGLISPSWRWIKYETLTHLALSQIKSFRGFGASARCNQRVLYKCSRTSTRPPHTVTSLTLTRLQDKENILKALWIIKKRCQFTMCKCTMSRCSYLTILRHQNNVQEVMFAFCTTRPTLQFGLGDLAAGLGGADCVRAGGIHEGTLQHSCSVLLARRHVTIAPGLEVIFTFTYKGSSQSEITHTFKFSVLVSYRYWPKLLLSCSVLVAQRKHPTGWMQLIKQQIDY